MKRFYNTTLIFSAILALCAVMTIATAAPWGPSGAASQVDPQFSGTVTVDGALTLSTAGSGLLVKTGTNATMGRATCNGATEVTVSTTKVTANSNIFLTEQVVGGTPAGVAFVSARTGGTSFGFKCAASDTSTVAWLIVEPAP